MQIKGLNHICISVSDLERSISFYSDILQAKLLVRGNSLAYFDLAGIWLALNVQKDIPRSEIYQSYTHLAFTVKERDLEKLVSKLKQFHVDIVQGRTRNERDRASIYFRDPDGHLLEFHTGSLEERLQYYKEEKSHMTFYHHE
ncbi:metallothiol transferase FosB [Marinicrinis lubricantis]|uniref:Metallothiol transferase FosB n=1 Tax=Marinicrinis lubricantis TaxID=2086470 RepID=A0ABW1INL6_9BACL